MHLSNREYVWSILLKPEDHLWVTVLRIEWVPDVPLLHLASYVL